MKDIREARDPAMRGSLAALKRAAEEARRIAILTGTELILMRNGQICSLPPFQASTSHFFLHWPYDISSRRDQDQAWPWQVASCRCRHGGTEEVPTASGVQW
jgi:hypothetical protein